MEDKKTVLVTGCLGQDGSYLVDKLLARNYIVVGVDLWNPSGEAENRNFNFNNDNYIFVSGDISEKEFMESLFDKYKPDWVFNMAAISLVSESFKIPKRIFDVNFISVLNMLEIIRYKHPKTRFLQASTSEQIGDNKELPQNHLSNMIPNSPYAISKLGAYHLVRLYRKSYGLFVVNSLCFNHESPRRAPSFVTRKITLGIKDIINGTKQYIELGNIDSHRDWGYAPEYVDSMIKMLEHEQPDDYTIATGETHTVREFVEESFLAVDKTITWKGEGMNEVGVDQDDIIRIKINPKFYRPAEVDILHGDYSYIKDKLEWSPKVKFKELTRIMVNHDLE